MEENEIELEIRGLLTKQLHAFKHQLTLEQEVRLAELWQQEIKLRQERLAKGQPNG